MFLHNQTTERNLESFCDQFVWNQLKEMGIAYKNRQWTKAVINTQTEKNKVSVT